MMHAFLEKELQEYDRASLTVELEALTERIEVEDQGAFAGLV